MRIITGAVLALSLLAGAAQAATPRDVVGKVADQIAARYFDAEKGAQIAADLKAEAARGGFDRYADPLDLATALSVRLKPLDSHFQVTWSAAPGAPPPGAQRPVAGSPAEADRRQNYGFRGLEMLPGAIAVVNMSSFASFRGAEDPAKVRADAVLALTAGADAVIFDLRDNGGGSPAMVGYLVSHFTPPGADVFNTFKSRQGPDRQERPPLEPAQRRTDVPLYILVSGRTASAAESFAYTLQAAKRAVVVGEPSVGGANPGGFVPAGDGFTVFVSGGRPVNPITKTNWEGTGVVPDVRVPAGEALAKAQQLALTRLLAGEQSELARTENRWALEALAPAAALPARTLSEYAGAYGERSVAVEAGRLVIVNARRPKVALRPLAKDLFAVEGAAIPIRMKFDRDQAGKVTGLVQMTGDGRQARFARTS